MIIDIHTSHCERLITRLTEYKDSFQTHGGLEDFVTLLRTLASHLEGGSAYDEIRSLMLAHWVRQTMRIHRLNASFILSISIGLFASVVDFHTFPQTFVEEEGKMKKGDVDTESWSFLQHNIFKVDNLYEEYLEARDQAIHFRDAMLHVCGVFFFLFAFPFGFWKMNLSLLHTQVYKDSLDQEVRCICLDALAMCLSSV